MPRLPLALALTLQLLGCAAPANALILCVSNDGCVALELVEPGTRRCAETGCDDGHAVDASHACRDIPLLGDAMAPARSPVAHGAERGSATLAVVPRLDRPAAFAALPAAPTPAPPDIAPRRTIVLQL